MVLDRADEPVNRLDQHPTREPHGVYVHPPGPTARCRTCGADVRVGDFTARSFAHHRLGTTVMDRCKATLCDDGSEYRREVAAWKAERAAKA